MVNRGIVRIFIDLLRWSVRAIFLVATIFISLFICWFCYWFLVFLFSNSSQTVIILVWLQLQVCELGRSSLPPQLPKHRGHLQRRQSATQLHTEAQSFPLISESQCIGYVAMSWYAVRGSSINIVLHTRMCAGQEQYNKKGHPIPTRTQSRANSSVGTTLQLL